MRGFTLSFAVANSLFVVCLAAAQDQVPKGQGSNNKPAHKMATRRTELSDAEYTRQALSAAPASVAKEAAVVRMGADGKMRTLREGKNGFTCMVIKTDKMCNDANSMEFFTAVMNHGTPPEKLGISYMLAGDDGASNTVPLADKKTADNHWIVTGPHIMITGAGAKTLGFPETPDPDPSQPYMMWAGSPYEHAMIPVAGTRPKAKSTMSKSDGSASEKKP